MEKDVLGAIRGYLLARQGFGMEVAYRVAAEGAFPNDEPRPAEREIVVLTSPVIERNPGIRVTSGARAAEQASLFGESAKETRLDLAKLDLVALNGLVSKCERCGLAGGRTRTVFGSGNSAARIVFIGEAPGREEDLQGLPFVGRAGQLLTKMLTAIAFTRDEVYITNILKCRPPGNREPQEDEMAACEPYLVRQLELIRPVMICALGRIAAHGLLRSGASLGTLRQGVHHYNDVPVAVTYHPAALLRNPNLKRDAWEDLQTMRKLYDEAIREGK